MARRPKSARNERAAARRARRRERAAERAATRSAVPEGAPARPRLRLDDAERQAREVGHFATSGDRPFVIGLVVLVLMALLTLSGPLQSFLDGRARVDTLSVQEAALAEENARLQQRVDELSDPDTIEQLAREQQGLVRPGEEAFVIVPPSPERPLIDTEPSSADDEGVPWWRRAWRALFGGDE